MIILPTDSNEASVNLQMNKAIELRQVSKRYPYLKPYVKNEGSDNNGLWALRDVSLDFEQGKILGIIGRNGAGKTTLLNIITGVLSPSYGDIIIKGKILGLFNLGVGFQDELTGRENIFLNSALLGATKEEINNKLNSIVDFSELGDFINMPLGSYSQGMRLRLGFSIVANLDFDILVIDEVLAVGDALFQNKCFQRLMDFKRSGKTLILSTQSMELIERLCDKAALLEHGKLLFFGDVTEGINRYRVLLNTERFFVGPTNKNTALVKNTKKWADNVSMWGNKFGTKEIIIESVEFINKFGRNCSTIKTNDPLKIKVNFHVKNETKNLHFGAAIFREDGVYCYGPNTAFDGYDILAVRSGKGYFILSYKQVSLSPGEYRISVAIWDKNETLAFDYHEGYYKLIVSGNKNDCGLVNIPYKCTPTKYNPRFNLFNKMKRPSIDFKLLNDKWGNSLEHKEKRLTFLKLLNSAGEEKDTFMTNETVKCAIGFCDSFSGNKNYHLWVALYRDDGICCQNIICGFGENSNFKILFRKLPLLPGNYRISCGVWDDSSHEFIMYHHGIFNFKMEFFRQDHGTIFLEHSWMYKLPR